MSSNAAPLNGIKSTVSPLAPFGTAAAPGTTQFTPTPFTPTFNPTMTGVGSGVSGIQPFRPAPFVPSVPAVPAPAAGGVGVGSTPFNPGTGSVSAAPFTPTPFVPFNPSQFQFRPQIQSFPSVTPPNQSPVILPRTTATPIPVPTATAAVPTPMTFASAAPAHPFLVPTPAPAATPFGVPAPAASTTHVVTPAPVTTNPTAPQRVTPTSSPSGSVLPRGAALASTALATVDLSGPSQRPNGIGSVGSAPPPSAAPVSGSSAASAGPSVGSDDPTSAYTTEHFSCHALLNNRDTAASVGLPFGVLLTPSVTLTPTPSQGLGERTTTHAPIECVSCGSVLNPYCPISSDEQSGASQWKCVLCRHINALSATEQQHQIESGLKVVDYVLSSPPPGLKPSPASAVYPLPSAPSPSAPVTPIANGAFDSKDHKTPPAASTVATGSTAAASSGGAAWTADGVCDVTKVLGHSIDNIYPDTYLFVIDTNLTKVEAQGLRSSIGEVVKHMHSDSYVGLITLSNTIALYDLTKSDIASANVISGEFSPSNDDLEYLFETGLGLGRVATSADTLLECVDALEASMMDKDDRAMEPRAVGAAVEVALSVLERRKQEQLTKLNQLPLSPLSSPSPPASAADDKFDQSVMGKTAAAAADTTAKGKGNSILSTGSRVTLDISGGHIVLCLSGSADFGPGAANDQSDSPETKAARTYFDGLSTRAHGNASLIHAFCVGSNSFIVPSTLRPLVSGCGGGVYTHTNYRDVRIVKDMIHALYRPNGVNGRLQVRTSSVVSVSRVIGAVKHVNTESDKQHSDLNVLTFDLCSVRPDGCISIYYRLADDIIADYVYFQFILTYTNLQRQRIGRVITRRLPTTGNFDTFVGSVDVNVTGVLIAKRTVLLASKTDDEHISEIIADLDDQVRDVAVRFGKKETVHGRFVSYALPKPIDTLPRMLYHLRRGPMLGPILQHSDDVDCLRSVFLHSPLTDSLRLLVPQLVSFNANAEFEELPLETLCCQSNRILCLDHHSHVMVWNGRNMTRSEFDPFRDAYAARIAAATATRLPAPKVSSFKEGSSESRWLLARLVPSHKDLAAEQLIAVPQLASLTPTARQSLVDSFIPTDEPSYFQYYRSLFNGS